MIGCLFVENLVDMKEFEVLGIVMLKVDVFIWLISQTSESLIFFFGRVFYRMKKLWIGMQIDSYELKLIWIMNGLGSVSLIMDIIWDFEICPFCAIAGIRNLWDGEIVDSYVRSQKCSW